MSKRYNFPEWLNKSKFDQYQLEQIKEEIKSGLESGIDTSIYAKPEFNCDQMRQIREGLESRLDVSIYAKLLRKQSELV